MNTLKTYTAHATMRNGLAQRVEVEAADEIDARRQFFALSRAIASITAPKVVEQREEVAA